MNAHKPWSDLQEQIVRCNACADLRAYAREIATRKRAAYARDAYWAKPVPAFGDPAAKIALVGLAPGAHGSNRTGRMFTGDSSGDFLYPALHRAGLASQEHARHAGDGMTLRDCVITSAARCAPPKNKPSAQHLANCLPFLVTEFSLLTELRVAVGLGRIGFDAAARALRALGYRFDGVTLPRFSHGCEFRARLNRRTITLLGCYHPSRQNTNTGVLTAAMFDKVLARALEL